MSDGAGGLQQKYKKQQLISVETSQGAALTGADSTIWVERGLLTPQSGLKPNNSTLGLAELGFTSRPPS